MRSASSFGSRYRLCIAGAPDPPDFFSFLLLPDPPSVLEAAAPAMQKRFRLPKEETERIERLLQRSVDRESGKECDLNVTEDNPDGREFESPRFPPLD